MMTGTDESFAAFVATRSGRLINHAELLWWVRRVIEALAAK
jgi:hypothetical protein